MLTRVDLRGEDGAPETLLPRPVLSETAVADTVREVIAEVRQRGDAALYDLTERLDGVRLESLVVPQDTGVKALSSLPSDLRDALMVAEAAVRRHHEEELRASRETLDRGLRIRTLPRPMVRAGCYVPGGRAAYPSTVLMTAVVARVAGVDEVVVCVPPGEGGGVAEVTLAATEVAGVDVVHPVGGAQAIAAMAYGTESVRKVDVIVGPGNVYVAQAKQQVAGAVGVPSAFTGPSEVVVVADGTSPAEFTATDLVAQTEHGPDGMSWLVTWDEAVADAVDVALDGVLEDARRGAEIAGTLASSGHCVLVDDEQQALAVVDAIAPEHLQLMVAAPEALAERVHNAGAVFLGPWTPTSIGDYVAGPSHVLPTAGTARFAGALTVADFTKDVNLITADQDALRRLGPHVEALAVAEGLEAHAESIRVRRQHG